MAKALSFAPAIFAAIFIASCSTTSGGNGTSGSMSASDNAKAASWSAWYDADVFPVDNPLSVSYDKPTKTAAITVANANASLDVLEMNAAYQVGNLNAGAYVITFTAWTMAGTQRITSDLQGIKPWGLPGSFDGTLTTTPTKYCYPADFAYARGAQITFSCNSTPGTFYVKDVRVTRLADYPYTLPTDAAATYDGVLGKSTVSFSCIPGAKDLYLYENAINDPGTATRLMDYDQATHRSMGGDGNVRKNVMRSESAPKSNFTITGYSGEGTYYYWISAKKAGGVESSKISAGSVYARGDFSNYADVPSDASCISLGELTYFCSTSETGETQKKFFYATAGEKVIFGVGYRITNPALVGAKIYRAAMNPSTYVLGASTTYNTGWQTCDRTITIPKSGYYVIEFVTYSVGDYTMSIGE